MLTHTHHPQTVPSTALYHSTHIAGSPFNLDVLPGATDYPFTTAVGPGLSAATAGEPAVFTIQARDQTGNNRISDQVAEAGNMFNVSLDWIDGTSNPTVTRSAHRHLGLSPNTVGKPEYLGEGKYRVEYTALRSGQWQLSIMAGGTDIYCGLEESQSCSPFTVSVAPGPVIAHSTEAESRLPPYMDSLTEASAGDMGVFFVQAKDTYGE